ncbi:rho guanine nucleotide exchange factor 7 [Daktulosphaira vitifoliae]|uniref:rho guanine nucleotide exchange factor 7 n=1 Tax=Daktulosphaira vitifoliae TaxID=58002 RepID=UPI0021AABD15|nr:rho guanine nucleotide exchange factor 7 [Daktulosphaira vitifoliae]XP_050528413.1 rho guanine nucleotide exchange factor 7 [Daktulosphaira vitifoliae]
MASSDPLLVQAVYSFKGKNNDELCLKKGDIVTVTQKVDGGWWEGTLNEKTGWFPSNYVREYLPQGENIIDNNVPTLSIDLTEQLRSNRAVVVMDIIESERAHVTELKTLIQSFLIPLKSSNVMSMDEYNQLVNNIEEVSKIHEALLESLEKVITHSQAEQRIGKLFLNIASSIRDVHLHYCSSHPRAVSIIEKYKDELNQVMETHGAVSPGILVLTVSLSKPFRRLDKYSGMLQELERHLEENHVDRGDTQRSVSVYKEIAATCLSTRRQKELELSILSGVVQGWEGADAGSLGDVIKIGSVAFSPEYKDRYLVLFSTHLLILSVSQRLSSFIYEGKLPLSGISVKQLENSGNVKNAFEIHGPMIESIIAVCQTKEEQVDWVKKINKQLGNNCTINKPTNKSVEKNNLSVWDVTRLRPIPSLQFCHHNNDKNDIANKRSERTFEDDGKVLRVFEAFCLNSKSRHTSSGN